MTGEPRTNLREQLPLWFGLLGGAAAWALHLGLSYLLLPTACRTGFEVLLHLITAVTVTVALIAAWSAHRVWSGTDRHDRTARVGIERDRFLAATGMFLSALFAALNLFEGLPVFFIDPCIGIR